MPRRDDDDGATLGLPGIVPPRRKKPPTVPRVTWVTPYYEAYQDVYKETPTPTAVQRMCRPIKPLDEQYGVTITCGAFRLYLQATPLQFYSAERFAESFPHWKNGGTGKVDRTDPRPGESADEYIARIGGKP